MRESLPQGRESAQPRSRIAVDLAAATAFAALTALGAKVQFHLPFTPVPVTGQVFCVLFAGIVLGARLGFVSQVEYLAAGAAGLPIFAHGGGPAALAGPTSGYLVAFPLAALVVGALAGRDADRGRLRSFLACLCGVAVIYLFGASWYGVWAAVIGSTAGLMAVLAQSVFPFIAFDIIKAALAAALAPPSRALLR
jgi:biotin transport system substrate-specific component